MAWYASENIDRAVQDTKELILPFETGKWARLALIVFFTGGGGFNFFNLFNSVPNPESSTNEAAAGLLNMNLSLSSLPAFPGFGRGITGMSTLGPGAGAGIIALLVVIVILLALIFGFISSVFEFVYFQVIRDKDVVIGKNFSRHTGNGLRYFGFRIFYGLLWLVLLGGMVVMLAVNPFTIIPIVLVGLPVLVLLAVFGGLVHDFVLLEMMESGEGLVASWKSVWPSIKGEWRQVAVFIFVRFVINLAIGIIVGIISILAGIVFLAAFGIPAFVLFDSFAVLAAIVAVLGFIAWFVSTLFISVPFRTFFYDYLVFMYEDIVGAPR